MKINLTDPANHPANGPLPIPRIECVIKTLKRSLDYQKGGDMAYVIADAIKGLEELLVSRAVEIVLPDKMATSGDMNLYQKSFAQGHNPCRAAMLQSTIDSESRSSPLETQGCCCRTCRPVTMTDMRFVVCPDCGNKRCPHANDHRKDCTGSNELGQQGSAYPATPQEVK